MCPHSSLLLALLLLLWLLAGAGGCMCVSLGCPVLSLRRFPIGCLRGVGVALGADQVHLVTTLRDQIGLPGENPW